MGMFASWSLLAYSVCGRMNWPAADEETVTVKLLP